MTQTFPDERALSVTVAKTRQLAKPLVSLSFAGLPDANAAAGGDFGVYFGG
jgi:hypothetical protein